MDTIYEESSSCASSLGEGWPGYVADDDNEVSSSSPMTMNSQSVHDRYDMPSSSEYFLLHLSLRYRQHVDLLSCKSIESYSH